MQVEFCGGQRSCCIHASSISALAVDIRRGSPQTDGRGTAQAMHLATIRLVRLGPFEDLVCPLSTPEGEARRMTVVFGGGGVGKTTLLSAIAGTRPGHCTVLQMHPDPTREERGFAVAEWLLGDEDPMRPHALRVASPNALLDETEDAARLRRKENSLFDRQAAEQGGFACVALSGARWFSRQPVALMSPARSVLRYDVKAAATFDDASRSDLTREVKLALAYAAIAGAVADSAGDERLAQTAPHAPRFHEAMRSVVDGLTRLAGYRYLGVDASTLEPTFESGHGELVTLDGLPAPARHLASFGALPARALYAAFPLSDPRESQGVVLIDDAALHLDAVVQRELPSALRAALPQVQWILTSSSPDLAEGCESSSEVLALRRLPSSSGVELFEGEEATLH